LVVVRANRAGRYGDGGVLYPAVAVASVLAAFGAGAVLAAWTPLSR
jgi:hypothetical protein